jgi:hypothetical protein
MDTASTTASGAPQSFDVCVPYEHFGHVALRKISHPAAAALFQLLIDLFPLEVPIKYPGDAILAQAIGCTDTQFTAAKWALTLARLVDFVGDTFTIASGIAKATAEQVKAYEKLCESVAQPERPKAKRGKSKKEPVDPAVAAAEAAEKRETLKHAVASAPNMEIYLLHGSEGLKSLLAGQNPLDIIKTHKPEQFNWRTSIVRDAEGKAVIKDGRPVGIEAWTTQQFAGFYWSQISYHRAERGAALAIPDWARLGRTIKSMLSNFGAYMLYDRIIQYRLNYQAIMSIVGKYDDLPDDTCLQNALVNKAYTQWMSLSEMERYEQIQKIPNPQ